ncbi:hypothetical protein [uncultured Photobacterium sp.]|uniref:hypothetical protein n=1 Tax=uncultured Photobacterium sp. TaxID=173973 RepID=UPI0026084EBA|nr:hypothetical protein [uncultured Photobacterium sp.]
MSRWYWLMATLAVNAQAETLKVPSMFTLKPKSGDIMSSILNGECKSISDKKMQCTFNQILLSQKIISQDEFEAKLTKIGSKQMEIGNLDKLNGSLCDSATLKGMDEFIANISDERKKKHYNKVKSILSACPLKNIDEAKSLTHRLMKFDYETQNITCNLSINTYDLEFTAIGNGENSYWRNTSEPLSNSCGMTNVVSMRHRPKYSGLWEYRGQRVISMPENKTLLGDPCTVMETEPMVWSWDGDDIYKNCQIIGVGF